MARSFAAASSQHLTLNASPITNGPLTLAAWFWPDGLNTGNVAYKILQLGSQTTDNNYYAIGVYQNQLTFHGGSNNQRAQTTDTLTNQTWHHAVGLTESTTSRYAILNGVKSTHSIAATNYNSVNQTRIGRRTGSAAEYWNGHVAHAAVWNVALTDDEVASLYNSGIGADPRSVRPDALVAYWPLLDNDGDRDWWGSTHLAATNSPTYAQHPPLLMKSKPTYTLLGTADAAPTISSVTLSGTSQIGSTLTATVATSPASVDSIAYQWERAPSATPDPGDIADISGETANTLALTYTDLGALLDAGDAYVRCGAIATVGVQDSDEVFSAWQQVTVPSGGGFAGSPLKSPFLIA